MTAATYWIVAACGVLAILYSVYAVRSILAASAGNERMAEIAPIQRIQAIPPRLVGRALQRHDGCDP